MLGRAMANSLNEVQPSNLGSKKALGDSRNIIKAQRNSASQASKPVHAMARNPTPKQNVLLQKLCVDAANARDTIVPTVIQN